jgi:hypothetical protein
MPKSYTRRRVRRKSRRTTKRRRYTRRVKRGGSCRGTYAGTVPQILSAIGWPQKPSFVSYLARGSPP